jgi:hypothetical protein
VRHFRTILHGFPIGGMCVEGIGKFCPRVPGLVRERMSFAHSWRDEFKLPAIETSVFIETLFQASDIASNLQATIRVPARLSGNRRRCASYQRSMSHP